MIMEWQFMDWNNTPTQKMLRLFFGVMALFGAFANAFPIPPKRTSHSSTTLYGFFDRVESMLFLPSTGSETPRESMDPFLVLMEFPDLEEEEDTSTARESLERFLQLWARQLEDDPKGLATPIVVQDFRANRNTPAIRSMKQRGLEKGVLPDRKGAKVDAWSPGGVELVVSTNADTSRLALTARRCDMDGDTVIKQSSERAIVRRLKEAIRIWKKVRAMKWNKEGNQPTNNSFVDATMDGRNNKHNKTKLTVGQTKIHHLSQWDEWSWLVVWGAIRVLLQIVPSIRCLKRTCLSYSLIRTNGHGWLP
jgi:hypothetical protein